MTTNDSESYNERQRMVQQVTTSVQRVTTRDNDGKRMTASRATSGNEWYNK